MPIFKIWDEKNLDCFGVGECGPLPGLSVDGDTEEFVRKVVDQINANGYQLPSKRDISSIATFIKEKFDFLEQYPAIFFSLETARSKGLIFLDTDLNLLCN